MSRILHFPLVRMARHFPAESISEGNSEHQYIAEFVINRHCDLLNEVYFTGLNYKVSLEYKFTLMFGGKEYPLEVAGESDWERFLTNRLKLFYNSEGQEVSYVMHPFYPVIIRVYADTKLPKKMMLVGVFEQIPDNKVRNLEMSKDPLYYVKVDGQLIKLLDEIDLGENKMRMLYQHENNQKIFHFSFRPDFVIGFDLRVYDSEGNPFDLNHQPFELLANNYKIANGCLIRRSQGNYELKFLKDLSTKKDFHLPFHTTKFCDFSIRTDRNEFVLILEARYINVVGIVAEEKAVDYRCEEVCSGRPITLRVSGGMIGVVEKEI